MNHHQRAQLKAALLYDVPVDNSISRWEAEQRKRHEAERTAEIEYELERQLLNEARAHLAMRQRTRILKGVS